MSENLDENSLSIQTRYPTERNMFKPGRWRSDKSKIKAVFKLQFQATQVPELRGKTTLTISLIPADVGKPTVRLGKAVIRDGSCKWESPIYETVKFIKELKTGKIQEKIYRFIVSTGSANVAFLGEALIDFADYAETNKPSTVSLPLKNSKSGTTLLVTIQNVEGEIDQRYVEENGESTIKIKSQERSLRNHLSMHDPNGDVDHCSTIAPQYGLSDKTASQLADNTGILTASSGVNPTEASRSDNITSPSQIMPHDLPLKNGRIHDEATRFLAPLRQSSTCQKGTADANHMHRRSYTACSLDSTSGESIFDLLNSPEENYSKLRLQQNSNSPLEKLKNEVFILERQAEVSELEIHSLRRQILKESKRVKELSGEVVSLKVEKDAFIKECKQLKVSYNLQCECEELRVLLEETRKDLICEKDISSNLQMQLKQTQESNSELVLALKELDENNEEQMKMQNDSVTYLATIKELEVTIKRLDKQKSESSNAVNELRSEIEVLEKHIEEQAKKFENDLQLVTYAKVEQEQRAIKSEEELRKTRWNDANAAEKIQEEFRRVSVEMAAKLDENEKLAVKAVKEASELQMQKRILEETLQKANEETLRIKIEHGEKMQELLNIIHVKEKQIKSFSIETENLRAEIGRLKVDKEQIQRLTDEKALLIQQWNEETDDLKRKLASARKEAEESKEELSYMRSLKSEEDLKKKLKQFEEHFLDTEMSAGVEMPLQHGVDIASDRRELKTYSEKELKGSNFGSSQESNLSELINEVAFLKERNKSMEGELKEMQERYSDLSLKFAEVEGERQQLVRTVRILKNGKKN